MPEIDAEYVERMEDVLRLYAKPADAAEPVVCFDERPVVLHDDARLREPARPGRRPKRDFEYVRRGTANVFCIVEPKTGHRLSHATKNRTGKAYARALKRIGKRYPDADTIHLVQDNLSTHSKKSLVGTLGAVEGLALWERFTIHYTPKHASWLNAAEIEASLVARECLGNRRIGRLSDLQREVTAWRRLADRDGRKIRWRFTVNDARRVFRYAGLTTLRSVH